MPYLPRHACRPRQIIPPTTAFLHGGVAGVQGLVNQFMHVWRVGPHGHMSGVGCIIFIEASEQFSQ